jgi:hypothetical protein
MTRHLLNIGVGLACMSVSRPGPLGEIRTSDPPQDNTERRAYYSNPPSISSPCSPVFTRDIDLERRLDADSVILRSHVQLERALAPACDGAQPVVPANATCIWARRSWLCASTLASRAHLATSNIALAKELAPDTVRGSGASHVWGGTGTRSGSGHSNGNRIMYGRVWGGTATERGPASVSVQ